MFKKIYKKILVTFFNIFYKKPVVTTNKKHLYNVTKKIFKVNKIKYKIYLIKKGKVFTNSVDDAAYISNNYLLKGPSYQYRASINKKINENYVLKNGTPKLIKKFKGNILSIISGGASKHNYGHWIFDVLSRIFIFQQIYSLKKIDYFYVPNYKLNFQKETLGLLGIRKTRIIDSEKFKYISADKIYAMEHPFSHKLIKISPFIIKEIKKNLFCKININFNNKKNAYKKIYIERDYSRFNLKGDLSPYSNERILINNDEVANFLKKRGFKVIQLNNMSFAKQAKIFNEANIVISMSGAELSNIIFCKPKTKIIEIKNNLNDHSDFMNLSKICGLKHFQIKSKPIFHSNVPQNGIIKCSLDKLKKTLY